MITFHSYYGSPCNLSTFSDFLSFLISFVCNFHKLFFIWWSSIFLSFFFLIYPFSFFCKKLFELIFNFCIQFSNSNFFLYFFLFVSCFFLFSFYCIFYSSCFPISFKFLFFFFFLSLFSFFLSKIRNLENSRF